MTGESTSPILQLDGLTVEYRVGHRRPPFRAVDDVSFTVPPRTTLGVVGESGSGKTTIGRAILGLVPVAGGQVHFAGRDITRATYQERRRLSAALQVVFQDPYSSLNPARTIGQTLSETLRPHGSVSKAEIAERVALMLERVGLPRDAVNRYPNQFSGGQRQRIAIARAIMVSPSFVVCDEAVSALDLSVQAQVLNLLRELQDSLQLSYLFISHDLALVRHMSHQILVLYRGRAMEHGAAEAVYDRPAHPYTRALLDSALMPEPHSRRRRRSPETESRPPTPGPLPSGSCHFAPRCLHAVGRCRVEQPKLERSADGTLVACHRWRELRIEERKTAGHLAGRRFQIRDPQQIGERP